MKFKAFFVFKIREGQVKARIELHDDHRSELNSIVFRIFRSKLNSFFLRLVKLTSILSHQSQSFDYDKVD